MLPLPMWNASAGHIIFSLKSAIKQCDQKKLPIAYKSCPKMIDFDTFAKIVAKGFEKMPKVQ